MKTITFNTLKEANAFINKLNSLNVLWGRKDNKSLTVDI